MLRNRLLILLGGCFLTASAAWADDVGYVDCSNRSEDTQVFAKPRKTPDVVAAIPCGERFTIIVYGFVFSRIQTGDGKIGYVYSNLIAVDRAATVAQQSGSVRLAADKSSLPSTRAAVVKPNPPAPAQPQPAPAQVPEPTSPAHISNTSETTATVAQLDSPASTQPQPTPAPLFPTPAASVQPTPTVPSQPEPASAQPAPVPVSASASPASVSNAPEPAATAVQPARIAPKQPEPSSAELAAPSIRPASDRTSWERPNPSMRRRAPLLELYGGYAFARLDGGGGTTSNLNGAMGSFGWNVKPWLQLVADSSYSFVTISGTKNVLYGNHFGPRYFHRSRNRWGLTPFVEALVGGSRSDTTITGVGGYTSSANSLSYKAGGGVDIHPSRRLDIRLFDVDYYRTSFGANLHQNNYWASTGIVIRLFGGGSE
jgi:hypothetical protein